jgi:hypothetical protein
MIELGERESIICRTYAASAQILLPAQTTNPQDTCADQQGLERHDQMVGGQLLVHCVGHVAPTDPITDSVADTGGKGLGYRSDVDIVD